MKIHHILLQDTVFFIPLYLFIHTFLTLHVLMLYTRNTKSLYKIQLISKILQSI